MSLASRERVVGFVLADVDLWDICDIGVHDVSVAVCLKILHGNKFRALYMSKFLGMLLL